MTEGPGSLALGQLSCWPLCWRGLETHDLLAPPIVLPLLQECTQCCPARRPPSAQERGQEQSEVVSWGGVWAVFKVAP